MEEAELARTFTAYIEWDPEPHLYVGIVPSVHGAHTQAATLDELRENLQEMLALCLEESGEEAAGRSRLHCCERSYARPV